MDAVEELRQQIKNLKGAKRQDKELDLSALKQRYWRNGVVSELGYPRRTVSKKNRYIDITYKHSNVIIKPHPTIHSMWEYVYTYTNRQPNFSKSTRYVETHKSIIPYNHINAKLTLFDQRKGEFDVG